MNGSSCSVSCADVSFKCLWIQQGTNCTLQSVHHEHGAHHPAVSKGRTSIKGSQSRLGVQLLRCIQEAPIRLPLDVTLHTCLDGIKRLRQVASKQSAEQGSGDTSLGVRVKLIREVLPQGPPHDGRDGEVTARPQSLPNRGAREPAHDVVGRGNVLDSPERSTALPLLLDHNQLERRRGQGAYYPRADPRAHFLVHFELPVLPREDCLLEGPSHRKLDHCARAHIDAVGPHPTVHFARVKADRLALLGHVLCVVEWLQTQNFDDTHHHTDGGILSFIQLCRHD
mmetsp:Transcript_33143/g.79158  ORF Transcript_33143/g.79158 Transcript_33143/m.79158 type:complete len:283 (-) Transcript_33143:222-1070(-)